MSENNMYTLADLVVMAPIVLLLIVLINFLEKLSKNQPNTSVYHEPSRDPNSIRKRVIHKKKKQIAVEDGVIKSFLLEGEKRRKRVKEFYNQIKDKKENIQFNELIKSQSELWNDKNLFLTYEYLSVDHRRLLIENQTKIFCDFNNIGFNTLNDIKDNLNLLENSKKSILVDIAFDKVSSIDDFLDDLNYLIKNLRQESNYVFKKIEKFESLTPDELDSFVNSIRNHIKRQDHLSRERKLSPPIKTSNEFLNIIREIFSKGNEEILSKIKIINNLRVQKEKLEDKLQDKTVLVENFTMGIAELDRIFKKVLDSARGLIINHN